MLYNPAEAMEKVQELGDLAARGKAEPVEAAAKMLAILPDFSPAIQIQAVALRQAGKESEAEEVLWSGLARCPCSADLYISLAGILTALRPGDPTAMRVTALAFWKLSLVEEIRPDLVTLMRPIFKSKKAAKDPYAYGELAAAYEEEIKVNTEKEDPRIAPYRVLNELQVDAGGEVREETLREVLEEPAKFAPLLYAAIREWANSVRVYHSMYPEAIGIFVAILGEIGGPDLIGDLVELSQTVASPVFLHVHWAIHRLGQRFPGQALEAFRMAARGASAGTRCGLAEQLNLLPAIEGVVPALAELVEGFATIAKDDDAGYLLAVVTDAMAERDAVQEAHSVLARCRPLLDREEREWLDETINGDEEFVPTLVEEEISEFTIEEVCRDRIYMDEEGDEEFDEDEEFEEFEEFDDGEFEEEEEFELKPVFTPRVGRNDPCWCGSGKKYKKCHLPEDEKAHLSARAPAAKAAGKPLPLRILGGLERWHTKSDRSRTKKMFFGTDEDRNRDESELDGYVQFLLHDYRDQATGRTLIEHYLEDHDLTPAERAEVESMRDARFGLYEMYKIEKGRGIHMRDVFDQETFFVEDITSSRHSVKGDCALLRVQLLEGRYILSGNGMGVPREFLDEMKRFVNAGSGAAGQSDAEFVRANSHLLRRHVQDLYARRLANLKVEDRYGDAVEFWTGTYEVLDRQALLEKLRSLKQLIENASKDSAVNFGWVDPDDRAVHGTIEVSEPRLSLQTMTRKQFELGRGMLEYEAGPLLKYLGDTSTTVEDMKRNVGKGGGRPLPPPSEQEREAILEVKARHYATWPDEKLPALKGKTPRQAIRTKAGREAVRELLSVMENQEARMGKDGDPVYDFDILRRKLGLEGE